MSNKTLNTQIDTVQSVNDKNTGLLRRSADQRTVEGNPYGWVPD